MIATGFNQHGVIGETDHDNKTYPQVRQGEQTRILTEQNNVPLHQSAKIDEIAMPEDPTPKFIFDDEKINLHDTDLEVPAFIRRNS